MAMVDQQMPHPPQFGGPTGYRPRFHRFPAPGARFRPPGFAGQINDGRMMRPWIDHRPGYTPSTFNSGK